MSGAVPQFIGGAFRPSAAEAQLESRNPSDLTDLVARVPEGCEEDVAAAVAAAFDALGSWRKLPGTARADALHRWAGAVQARQEELAQAMAREVGKPIAEARGEAARAVAILRYYAGEAVRATGEVIPSQLPDTLQFTLRDPLGVVALVTPWNFPLAIPLWKAAPALAFGNTVVLKPSELSAACAHLLAETAQQAGLPAGVFNVVHGSGPAAGEPLLRHSQLRGVSFTGSVRTGARVAELASARNLRYQTEMGGKNAVIVLADADLARAAALTAGGAMRYAGQKCTATSRAFVDRKVFEAFLSLLRAQIEALPLGPVTDPACAVGPVISRATRDRVADLLRAEADRCLIGGAAPAGKAYAKGSFLAPTLVTGVATDSPLLTQELFCPVLVMIPVDGPEEAIAAANASPYGLSASLFTGDLKAALAYVRTIEAGLVRVNGDTTGVDPHAPFGGVKGSSSGTREQGPAAREFYTELRTVQIS